MRTAKKILAVLAGMILLMTGSMAMAETKIIVTGTGETRVSADTAVISLGVSARDKDVLQAQQKVNTVIATIRAALTAKGVKDEDINTDFMNIYAIYDYQDDQEIVTAYNASSTLAIKVENIDDTGMLIDEAFAAGANTLNNISFSAKNTDEAGDESLTKAIADAKHKAEVIAEASGLTITGIEEISEGGVYSYGNTSGNFFARDLKEEAAAGTDAGTVVSAAKLVVSATVSVTFTAE